MNTVICRIFAICGVLIVSSCTSTSPSSGLNTERQPEHGYVLIQIDMKPRFKNSVVMRDRLDFRSFDSDEVFGAMARTPYSNGLNSWVSLISVPEGNYFFSHYVTSGETSWSPPISSNSVSKDEVFEVRSGVINYVGDWELQEIATNKVSVPDVDVSYDLTTIEKSAVHFPDQMKANDVYISMRGRVAISLSDFLEIVNRNSGSER